jgi:hypothetical protein
MKVFLICFLFVLTNEASANSSVKILKIFANKREFVIQKIPNLEEGSKLVIQSKVDSASLIGKLKLCKAKSCLAQLDPGMLELDPRKINSYYCTLNEVEYKNSAYIGYGTPLGGALKVGIRYLNPEFLSYGMYLSRVESSSGSTKVTANSLSFQGIYEVLQSGNWFLNLNGELGFAFSVLKLNNEANQRNVKENVYVAALSLEGLYRFGRYLAGVNFGLSKNGLKSKYTGEGGEFSNPYGETLVYSEFAIHYEF